MQDNDIDGSGKAASAGMTAPQTVADVLDAAAVTVGEGWCQGVFHDSHGCFCALGAIAKACGTSGWRANFKTGTTGAAAQKLREVVGCLDVDDWNDAESRTQSEVVAALLAAATSARQGETK